MRIKCLCCLGDPEYETWTKKAPYSVSEGKTLLQASLKYIDKGGHYMDAYVVAINKTSRMYYVYELDTLFEHEKEPILDLNPFDLVSCPMSVVEYDGKPVTFTVDFTAMGKNLGSVLMTHKQSVRDRHGVPFQRNTPGLYHWIDLDLGYESDLLKEREWDALKVNIANQVNNISPIHTTATVNKTGKYQSLSSEINPF